jgi:hypothetical protein
MFVGHVDFQLLGWLLIGSVPGVWLGARISSSIPQKYLRWALAIVLGSIGVRLTGIWM